jgi:tRNA dimethylallyltransferase
VTPPGAPTAALLCGPTAAGKTALALAAAAHLPLEIISADSRQVYRHLRIGTAQPTAAERAAVPHHLIDFLELDETYNAARFAADALRAAADIRARGRIPLVVGGAGFYFRVLEHGLFEPPYDAATLRAVRAELVAWSTADLHAELAVRDSERAAALHPNDRYRIGRALEICIAAGRSVTELTAGHTQAQNTFVHFRITIPRPVLHARIAARTEAMFAAGWEDEVGGLLHAGVSPDAPALATLGYPQIVARLRGEMTRDAAAAAIVRDTRRFARAQETWFRKLHQAVPVAAEDPAGPAQLAAQLARAFGR